MKLPLATVILCSTVALAAHGQNLVVINEGNHPPPISATAAGTPQRVTITFQMSMPTPDTEPHDLTGLVESANKSLDDMVNRECDVLAAVFKGPCRLSSLNVSSNFSKTSYMAFGPHPGLTPAINAHASATYEIDVAAPPSTTVPPEK